MPSKKTPVVIETPYPTPEEAVRVASLSFEEQSSKPKPDRARNSSVHRKTETSYPPEVRAILQALDDPDKLLGAILDHALLMTGSERGIVFDHQQIIRAVGFSQAEKTIVWKALDFMLVEAGGLAISSQPLFEEIIWWPEHSERSAPAFGVAGVLTGPPGNLAVLAVEKHLPLEEARIASFAEWLQVASMPTAVSMTNARLSRMLRREPLKLRDLPLNELEELPRLQEIQTMLIADAMRRSQNNKRKAAAALGISREGLRRKQHRESETVHRGNLRG